MSGPAITKKELRHLAELARLTLATEEEERLGEELERIVEYVTELQAVDTSGASQDVREALHKNIFREDGAPANTNQGKGTDQFPEKERGYLKVPPVLT